MIKGISLIPSTSLQFVNFFGSFDTRVKTTIVGLSILSSYTILNTKARKAVFQAYNKLVSNIPLINQILPHRKDQSHFVNSLQKTNGKDLKTLIQSIVHNSTLEEALDVLYKGTLRKKNPNASLKAVKFPRQDVEKSATLLKDQTLSNETIFNAAKDVWMSFNPLSHHLKSPIEKRADFVDRIATRLSVFLYTLTGRIFNVSLLLQRIETYPKTLFTLIFAFMVPISFAKLWAFLKPTLESVFGPLDVLEAKHAGKIALAALGLTGLIFYLMRRENVHCITDLGAKVKYAGIPHKGLFKLDCYQEIISSFRTIFERKRGRAGSNAFLVHEKDAEGSLTEIPHMLAELSQTAALDGFNNKTNIWKVNVDTIVADSDTIQDVRVLWNNVVRDSRRKNAVLHLGDFDWIVRNQEAGSGGYGPGESKEYRLAKLILSSIERGQVRVIFEGNKHDAHKLSHMPRYSKLFQMIDTPPIEPKELREPLERVYNPLDRYNTLGLTDKAIDQLINTGENFEFNHLLPEEFFEHADDIVRTVGSNRNQEPVLKEEYSPEKIKSIRDQYQKDQEKLKIIAKGAGKKLVNARKKKESYLRFLWQLRQKGLNHTNSEVIRVCRKLLVLDRLIIPILHEDVMNEMNKLQNYPTKIDSDMLLDAMNSHFRNLLGPPTKAEREKLRELPKKLQEDIKGRKEIIEDVCEQIVKWRITPAKHNDFSPAIVFAFIGPPGTGKSVFSHHLAKKLGDVHGIIKNPVDDPNYLILNLPTFFRKGRFDEKLAIIVRDFKKKNPTGVIAFDEFDKLGSPEKYDPTEKASPIDQLLLLIGDTKDKFVKPTEYSEHKNQVPPLESVDHRNNIFILISNDDSDDFKGNHEEDQKTAEKIIEGKYGPAFKQRISKVEAFSSLHKSSIEEYIDMFTDKFINLFTFYQGTIEVEESLKQHFAEKAKELNGSIRPLYDYIRLTFTNHLSDRILKEEQSYDKVKKWKAVLSYNETVNVKYS